MRHIWLGFASIASALALASSAFADIKAYNAAVIRGDYVAAAHEAEGVWPGFDKARPETAATAREFAWTSMLAGQADKARVYAKFLVEEGARIATPDDDPLMAKLLLQWAELGQTPKAEAADALSATLKSWAASHRDGNRIATISAAQLYAREWNLGRWKATQRDALLAAELAARLGKEGMAIEERAKVDSAAAQFMDAKKVSAWVALADIHDALMTRMGPPVPGEKVAELNAIDMRAHAWLEAIDAYFRASANSTQTGRKLKSRCGEKECDPPGAGGIPWCAAAWDQTPKLNYPMNALFRGMVGATILEMTTDETGAVTNYKVMAAVPSDTFPDATTKVVQKWKFKRTKDAVEPCTLAGTRQLHVIFRMD